MYLIIQPYVWPEGCYRHRLDNFLKENRVKTSVRGHPVSRAWKMIAVNPKYAGSRRFDEKWIACTNCEKVKCCCLCFFDLGPHFHIPECNSAFISHILLSKAIHLDDHAAPPWSPPILCEANPCPPSLTRKDPSDWEGISKKIFFRQGLCYSSTNVVLGT